jgi:type IV secretory pathway TraG/TraD family ATPase VirD4
VSATTKRRNAGITDGETILIWMAIIPVVLVLGGTWLAIHTSTAATGIPAKPAGNPFQLLVDVVKGKTQWTGFATFIVVAVLLTLAAALGGVATLAYRRRRSGRGPSRVDKAARHMGTGRDITPITLRGARETARRLGVPTPGLPLARTVAGGVQLYMDWQACGVVIAGPRTMKTSAIGIPFVLSAPGAVVVTSNKRDIVDSTRDPRADLGEVVVFDPQGIVNEPVTWWFNPLSTVKDETTAVALAEILLAAYRKPGERRDPFFDMKAKTLLTGLLLAAAVRDLPITTVHQWLSQVDDAAVGILRDFGWDEVADAIAAIINTVAKQRDGVYGTATNATEFLMSKRTAEWITPGLGRRELKVDEFVQGTGTLYCISKEGVGSAVAVITALTVAVLTAAETLAARSPGGRLATPLVCVLDEAANVCRWPDLPLMYSHYGSRGIIVATILQSWSQGVGVWGRDGMESLWSAATVKVYGGGAEDIDGAFLQSLSKRIGDYNYTERSASSGRGGRSVNVAQRTDRILDVADLAELPRGRAVVLASGCRAVLAKTTPWIGSKQAEVVRASIKANDPTAA